MKYKKKYSKDGPNNNIWVRKTWTNTAKKRRKTEATEIILKKIRQQNNLGQNKK